MRLGEIFRGGKPIHETTPTDHPIDLLLDEGFMRRITNEVYKEATERHKPDNPFNSSSSGVCDILNGRLVKKLKKHGIPAKFYVRRAWEEGKGLAIHHAFASITDNRDQTKIYSDINYRYNTGSWCSDSSYLVIKWKTSEELYAGLQKYNILTDYYDDYKFAKQEIVPWWRI